MRKATNLNVRTSAGQLDEWKRLAGEDGLSLSAWVHVRLNGLGGGEGLAGGGLDSGSAPDAAAPLVGLPALIEEPRRGGCEHRLPRGTWCKRCQTIRK